MLNIHKARLLDLLLPRPHGGHALAEFLAGLVQVFLPLDDVGGPLQGSVVGEELRVRGLHLQVAAGIQVLERLAEETVVVRDESHHLTAVDVVEGSGEEPVVLPVVDLECAVWGDPGLSFVQ